jgi:hypothetical protein
VSGATDTFGGMKRTLLVLTATALLLTGCASGPSSVTLPEVAGDTPEEQFVNTVRGGLVDRYATWSSEDVLNIGTTICHVYAIDDTDPENSIYEAGDAQGLTREDSDFLIAASKRYLCTEA